jgi:CMP-N-acetylneuraminate monooxygenase
MILNNLKELGVFLENKLDFQVEILKSNLQKGLNDIGNFIVKLSEDETIEYVVNKVCDHAGGKMILKDNYLLCPLHGWKLDTSNLKYDSSHIKKQKIDFKSNDKLIYINDFKKSIFNPYKKIKKGKVKIHWLNHATVYIECNGKSIITDPWLFGPAFLTGWWLQNPSPRISIDLLKQVDYVYISHNHPDHLHTETLSILNKNQKFIIPDFKSKSVQKFLKNIGFSNINSCDFNHIYELAVDFQFSIFKSGDFRDDSGIYLNCNGHEILLTVDANFLNSHLLPVGIDLLMTSFAGGASGFPLCYSNYNEKNKIDILKRNKAAVKYNVHQYIKITKPINYMPYAGMFNEKAQRDSYINKLNKKNLILDYSSILEKENVNLVETNNNQIVCFEDGKLQISKIDNLSFLETENINFYIELLKIKNPIDDKLIIEYFKNSNYKDSQILQIFLCDDNFSNKNDFFYFIDFYNQIFEKRNILNVIKYDRINKLMNLNIRTEVFMAVVNNMLPWEDFSIGFQMRIERFPDVYESEFWYHFTNNYICDMNYRYDSTCGSCEVVKQNPIWNEI